MRTPIYMITKLINWPILINLDDCIDHALTNMPDRVEITTTEQEMGVEDWFVFYDALYTWHFPEDATRRTTVYGTVNSRDNEERRSEIVKKANESLQKDIARIKSMGIEVICEREFQYESNQKPDKAD